MAARQLRYAGTISGAVTVLSGTNVYLDTNHQCGATRAYVIGRSSMIAKRAVILIGLLLAPALGTAGDIVNGWSDTASIQLMRSYATYTDFLLPVSQAGCGTASLSESWWRLPLDSSEASRYKRAALLGAFLAGKPVQLRCENSTVTDFAIGQ